MNRLVLSSLIFAFAFITDAHSKQIITPKPQLPDNKAQSTEIAPEQPQDGEDNSSKTTIEEISKANKKEVLDIFADNIKYKKQGQVLTATGNVEVTYKGKKLSAQEVEYAKEAGSLSAYKDVLFVNDDGNIVQGSEIVVDDEFKNASLKDVKAVLVDGSRLESEKIELFSRDKYILDNSSYTPCRACTNSLFWKVSADKIVYNQESGRVFYRNAYLEVFDVPVLYTPYLSHPTADAKSKSGFLTPLLGHSSEYGLFFGVPYYYQFASNKDMTLTPVVTTIDGVMLSTEWRHLVEKGSYKIILSGIYPKERNALGDEIAGGNRELRGHLELLAHYNINEDWQFKMNAKRSTDDTYLSRYNISTEDLLTSTLGFTRIVDRDFTKIQSVAFQGLRVEDNKDSTPVVIPTISGEHNYNIDPLYNQRVVLGYDVLNLRRTVGADSTRIVTYADYLADYISDNGIVFNSKLHFRADYYNLNDVDLDIADTNSPLYDEDLTRFIPELTLSAKYPLINYFEDYSLTIEPHLMAVASGGNHVKNTITNEDSQNLELYDYNLFEENHLSGLDYVERGTRFNYGIRGLFDMNELGDVSFLIGQTYRMEQESFYDVNSGMLDKFSDYVGRLSYSNSDNFGASYRFRVNKDSGRLKRSEAGVNIASEDLTIYNSHIYIDGEDGEIDRQEIYTQAKYFFTDTWGLVGDARRNLDNDNNDGWVHFSSGLSYVNDCFDGELLFRREFTKDRDIEPSSQIIFNFVLKNIGEK